MLYLNKKSQQNDVLRRTLSGQGFAFAKPWDALCSQRLKTQSVLPPGAGEIFDLPRRGYKK